MNRSCMGHGLLLVCLFGLVTTIRAESPSRRVTSGLPGRVPPVLGCWFWGEPEFAPGGYRPYLEMIARHANFNVLTTSLRVAERELTDPAVHAQIKAAAAHARGLGIGIAMDLDVRLARRAFQKVYPDELQEMLRVREIALKGPGPVSLRIASETLTDHYTGSTTPYIPLAGRLVRVYAYRRGLDGIDPETVVEITSACRVKQASAQAVVVEIPCDAANPGRHATVLAAFRHLAPDVFAPHLLAFQREILRQYADCGLAGACKDEWGFPPCFDGCPAKNDYWYSEAMRATYAERSGGCDLVRDCLLMTSVERGRQPERQCAINRFNEMVFQRNGAVEIDFYAATKTTLGPDALVATHPTWWPNPDFREFKKNGLDWWTARRDWAQTDEVTPFCVRTSLAKKWGCPLWYNMFYANNIEAYERGVWSHALGGGRINYHPLFPYNQNRRGHTMARLVQGDQMRADCRVRLLDLISRSPLDCPVAVVFGHLGGMNWAGPGYDDVGLAVASAFWRVGFPADLIPSSEITASHALSIDVNGRVQYGPQRYAGLVLYHPEFEPKEVATFFSRAAHGKTALVRVGEWTRGVDGLPFDAAAALPPALITAVDGPSAVNRLVAHLRAAGISPQTPATDSIGWSDRSTAAPPTTGHGRLIDGTEFEVSGTRNVAGDQIVATWNVRGRRVEFDAMGLASIRLGEDGLPVTLAAGGLKRCRVGSWDLSLERRIDLALWRDAEGRYHGVVQDDGPLPRTLTELSSDLVRQAVPQPMSAGGIDP